MLSFQWQPLLRRESNWKHYVLTILDVKVKGAKHIPSEWFSILLPCKQLRLPRSKKLFGRTKKRHPNTSNWIFWSNMKMVCVNQIPNSIAAKHTGRGTLSSFPWYILCYLICSCVVSCTSSTFPHVIIQSHGLFPSNKNHFNQTETFVMSADTKLQPRTRWLQSIGQACRWLRSISPCFAVA